MRWGSVKDRILEGEQGKTRCWILMNRELRVHGIYLKLETVSKFVPESEWEETLEGAKFRAEFELERFRQAKPDAGF